MKNNLINKSGWESYSNKVLRRLNNLNCVGYFSAENALQDNFLVTGVGGSIDDGCFVKLFWIVNSVDSTVVDAKFQAYGDTALLAAAEEGCIQVIGRKVVQVSLIREDKLELGLRDYLDIPSLPVEKRFVFGVVFQAIQQAYIRSLELVENSVDREPLLPKGTLNEGSCDENWHTYTREQKLELIETVLDKDVRPYVAMDGGGVDVLDISNNNEVVISYKGNCATCFYANGATLHYIQQSLSANLHPCIKVIPQF